MIRSTLVALALVPVFSAFAREEKVPVRFETEPQTRFFSFLESSYGFDANYERGGSGSAWEIYGSAGAIIPWKDAPLPGADLGQWQWRLGAAYHRFEFDNDTILPLPDRLQSISAIVALELVVSKQVALLLDVRPGVYFEDDISEQAFDVPVRLGFGYRVNDRFSLVGMARYRGLADNPIIGGVGFVWKVTDRITFNAIYPEPRLTWRASDDLGIWLGAEFAGGGFRTDRDPNRGRQSGAAVDYSDKRAMLGATWQRGDWQIEAAGGVSIEREWDYFRTGDRYETDEVSPFLKVNARLEF
jgi:hypothetical protein